MEGVIRSHPCLAEPVKLEILCMLALKDSFTAARS
jgi:hypothetical protein